MKHTIIFLGAILSILTCSITMHAAQDVAMQRDATGKKIALLYNEAQEARRQGNIPQALNLFKKILTTRLVMDPIFEDFELKIAAAENLVELYQLSNDEDRVRKYSDHVIGSYEDLYYSLRLKGDSADLVTLVKILHDIFNNDGSYTSLDGKNYTLYVDNHDKEKKATYFVQKAHSLAERQYALALMLKDGNSVLKKNISKAVESARAVITLTPQNSKLNKQAQELLQELEGHQKIAAAPAREAQYFAEEGFQKLRKFNNPVSGESVEGFDQQALILLGKSSMQDPNNFDVEYQLAEMYYQGMGIPKQVEKELNLKYALQHIKRALKIALKESNAKLINKARNLKALIDTQYFDIIKKRSQDDTSTQRASSSRFSTANLNKRASLFNIFGNNNKDTI